MRRTRTRYNINRNSDTDIYEVNTNPVFVNTVDPDFVRNQNRQIFDRSTGLDVIEINASDLSETTSEDTPTHNFSHAWSYINNTRAQQEAPDKYRINTKARERRRLRNDVQQNLDIYPNEYVHNSIYFDNIDVSEHDSQNVRLNHQINCFTIINKHFINSDTSSENTDYDHHELNRPMGDAYIENPDYYNLLEEEMLACNADFDAEKKTIWIYSFKNKHLLPDDCIELVNIPSKDTESSTSFTFEKFNKDPINTPRAASPIPPPFIPRLDLSLGQTLSTVTEVTEPNKQPSSVETDSSTKEPVVKKPKNSWVVNKNKVTEENINKQEKSTNIVNWMALSPRERRRFFTGNTDSDIVYKGKLATLQEICTKHEKDKNYDRDEKSDTIETHRGIQSTVVDVDVHVALPESTETCENILKEPTEVIPATNIIDVIEKENLEVTVIESIPEVNMCPRKPHIKLNQKCPINVKSITDPIEKLNSDNWIADEDKKETPICKYESDVTEEVNLTKRESSFTANDRLWSKNALALMKPAQWNEYSPIGESHLSLHLSLTSSFGKQTWLSRLINLFKCCK